MSTILYATNATTPVQTIVTPTALAWITTAARCPGSPVLPVTQSGHEARAAERRRR